MSTARFAFALALAGCTPMGPPVTPLVDSGPPMDSGVDAPAPDAPSTDDAPTDGGPASDVTMADAPATPDAPVDAPSCDMRGDCDSNGSCETVLGTTTNCMACGDRCTAPAGAAATCDFATGCDFTCNAGFDNCDAVDGNGCEVNINTDRNHCGDCATVCPSGGLNTRASCVGGDCLLSCNSGFADCDGDIDVPLGNGCEINTNTSLMHCGACDSPCMLAATAMNATASCAGGTCSMVCNIGFRDCDGDQSNGCERVGTTCA